MSRYAYVHARPDTVDATGIFYVGKGRKSRSNVLPARNRYHGFVLDKHGAENILVGKIECSNDEIAFELERGLVKCLRRAGVQLTNMTDGGDGTTGHVVTEEGRQRRAEQLKARWVDPEQRERFIENQKKTVARMWSDPETKSRVVAGMRGVKKTLSPAALEARRKNLEKARSPEAKAKNAEITRQRWATPEFKSRMANQKRGPRGYFVSEAEPLSSDVGIDNSDRKEE